MAQRIKGTGKLLYAFAIALSLGFGARELRADPTFDCPNDGWEFLGACASEQACDDACDGIHGLGAGGRCVSGCCHCFL
jgi:hypothetical protein